MPPPELEAIPTADYVRDVLPETFALWADGRDAERYADDLRRVAGSAYMRRRPFTVGFRGPDGTVVASCKNYDRDLRWGAGTLRATGIGAVFTSPAARAAGLGSALVAAVLDAERAGDRDVAYLFSDIAPAFYARLGFRALPSRLVALRAASLGAAVSGAEAIAAADWTGVRRCFEASDELRPWGFRRTPLVWDFMRDRWNAPPAAGTVPVRLLLRDAGRVAAYVVGRRVPGDATFVLDDYGFDGDDARARLAGLVRAAAGDASRIAGWLPPAGAREALPRGSVRPRAGAILMVAPISATGRGWWSKIEAAAYASDADAVWSADHI